PPGKLPSPLWGGIEGGGGLAPIYGTHASLDARAERVNANTPLALAGLMLWLFAARLLRQYVAQARRGAAGFEGLLLAFMRRPAGEPDDFQRRADAAVGVAVALGIGLHRRRQQRRRCQP